MSSGSRRRVYRTERTTSREKVGKGLNAYPLSTFFCCRAVLERNDVGSVRWDTWPVLALVGGFSAAQFLFYVVAPAVIRVTSATALNLALFTADFYILITGIALFKFKVGGVLRSLGFYGVEVLGFRSIE